MDGMAADGAIRAALPIGQVSQATVTVFGGSVVTVMIGGGVRFASALERALDAALEAAVGPEADAILATAEAAFFGHASSSVFCGQLLQSTVIVIVLIGAAICMPAVT